MQVDAKGRLVQYYRSPKTGGLFELDEKTLKQLHPIKSTEPRMPSEIGRLKSDFAGMRVMTARDLGESQKGPLYQPRPGVRYVMRWESRGVNRDRPFPGPVPPPSMLRVYKLEK